MELTVEVRDAEEGGFYARARGYGVFTDAEDWDGLRANVVEDAWVSGDRVTCALERPRWSTCPCEASP